VAKLEFLRIFENFASLEENYDLDIFHSNHRRTLRECALTSKSIYAFQDRYKDEYWTM